MENNQTGMKGMDKDLFPVKSMGCIILYMS